VGFADRRDVPLANRLADAAEEIPAVSSLRRACRRMRSASGSTNGAITMSTDARERLEIAADAPNFFQMPFLPLQASSGRQ
jgi:hypothetical protein